MRSSALVCSFPAAASVFLESPTGHRGLTLGCSILATAQKTLYF